MTRKKFKQDLSIAQQTPPPHILDIRPGEDGEINFEYNYSEKGTTKAAGLQLLALDIDAYPSGNDYMIFAPDGEVEVATVITQAIDLLGPLINGKSISEAFQEISICLQQATSGRPTNSIAFVSPINANEEEYEADDDDDGDDDWLDSHGEDDEAFGLGSASLSRPVALSRVSATNTKCADIQQAKADLRQARDAGFRVGIIGDLTSAGVVSISVRISKLGISEEAMKAWGVDASQYFLLLIKMPNGYRSIESVKEDVSLVGSTEIRLGLCKTYRPDSKAAFDAFNDSSKTQEHSSQASQSHRTTGVLPLFIQRSLNELFKTRFTRIVRFRAVYNLSWTGAEHLVQDTQGAMGEREDMSEYDHLGDEVVDRARALSDIVKADSLADRALKDCSLPLVAMQFALRHFVRCTEFCLVCHCSVGSTFEALKPYVCSKPLCLYQYMALGFGPSIEWEIMTQPYVVDLLISFCYFQAQGGRLKSFPDGIELNVPRLPEGNQVSAPHQRFSAALPHNFGAQKADPPATKAFSVRYNSCTNELLFSNDNEDNGQALKVGDFIALKSPQPANFSGTRIHRVAEKMLPKIGLDDGFTIHRNEAEKHELVHPDKFVDVDAYLFDQEFDILGNSAKCTAILLLLDMLPPVSDMLNFLKSNASSREVNLRQWRKRLPPAAINVLRWIIASNRSCIMQVDTIISADKVQAQTSEDRVAGMDEYMQFRFAQGAPDKEQRFLKCVKQETVGTPHPTLFAFHGSPLHNWHSIIREGLRFDDVVHGRAYGNGVYMSASAHTSIGFIGSSYQEGWPNSELKITHAMSLNEVVNKPGSFVSQHPHYVVASLDWIQTRYLFVQTKTNHVKGQQRNVQYLTQDPNRVAIGSTANTMIPISALPKSRQPVDPNANDNKKRKVAASGRGYEPIEVSDDDQTDSSLSEDAAFLDDEVDIVQSPILIESDIEMDASDFGMSPRKKTRLEPNVNDGCEMMSGALVNASKTTFRPSQLNLSNIKILPEPVDSSRVATTGLSKAFQTLIKVQQTTPAHVLGWYMNPELENMYQWIVELHSFDQATPLAADMDKADIHSIVIEMLFTNHYPHAPPFVRVVKPRFLPFSQGGGGHVTEGGAICMELLTNNGWLPTNSIESVLLQIKLAMSEQERPARLAVNTRHTANSVYGVGEAMAAYERACRTHGWTVPDAFRTLQTRGF